MGKVKLEHIIPQHTRAHTLTSMPSPSLNLLLLVKSCLCFPLFSPQSLIMDQNLFYFLSVIISVMRSISFRLIWSVSKIAAVMTAEKDLLQILFFFFKVMCFRLTPVAFKRLFPLFPSSPALRIICPALRIICVKMKSSATKKKKKSPAVASCRCTKLNGSNDL